MSRYFTVRVYTEQHDKRGEGHSCLVSNHAPSSYPQWGTAHSSNPAHRFLWKDQAEKALRDFLAGGSQPIYRSGRVYGVTEEPVGPLVNADVLPAYEASVVEEVPFDINDLEKLLRVFPASEQEATSRDTELLSWVRKHGAVLVESVRYSDRLEWLRMHPESCRSWDDCHSQREPGTLLCAACRGAGANAFPDVYQNFYYQEFDAVLKQIMSACKRPSARPDSPPTPQ